MTSKLDDLIGQLSEPQRQAINLLRLSLNCFNSADGAGLFAGVARYNILAGRVEICAVQAGNLPAFWALLLRRMQWPIPPKWADTEIVSALASADGRAVLQILATETASVITLARMLHDIDKQARRELRGPIGDAAPDFNDPIDF